MREELPKVAARLEEAEGDTLTFLRPPRITGRGLVLAGMTCAMCAKRIERKLNKLDDVRASIKHAIEQATVELFAFVCFSGNGAGCRVSTGLALGTRLS